MRAVGGNPLSFPQIRRARKYSSQFPKVGEALGSVRAALAGREKGLV